MMQFFKGSLIFSAIALAGLFYLTGNWVFIYQAITLSLIEVSLSFDNAVVNASKIKDMNAFWRKMFLTVGLFIAVGVMRVYLPVQIVSLLGDVSLYDAGVMALNDPNKFSHILETSHVMIAGFGGVFLLLTALEFFMNKEKEVSWFKPLENNLIEMGGGNRHLILATTITAFFVFLGAGKDFAISALFGGITFYAISKLKEFLENAGTGRLGAILQGGLGTFIYLEVLDASFSLDGVAAAFAVSSQIYVVATGLAIGALFVRSMTIALVETGQIGHYKYLESGAFLSILCLAFFMFIGVFKHVPEYVVATTSIGLIVGAVIHSIRDQKKGV